MTLRRAGRLAGDLALSAAAIAGVLCLITALASVAFGITPLVFRSGSMAPDIPTGSLGFARSVDAGDLEVGDVVSVSSGGTRVSHRIVEMESAGERSGKPVELLTLKGDANSVADPAPYPVTEADRLWFSVPVLGRVISWLSTAPGIYVLAGYLGLCVWLLFRRPGDDEPRSSRPAGGRRRAGRDEPADDASDASGESSDTEEAVDQDGSDADDEQSRRHVVLARRGRLRSRMAVVAAGVLAATGWASVPAQAEWIDNGTVSGASLNAGSVQRVGQPSCSSAALHYVVLRWGGVGDGTTYRVDVHERSNNAFVASYNTNTSSINFDATTKGLDILTKYVAYVRAQRPGTGWVADPSPGINFTTRLVWGADCS